MPNFLGKPFEGHVPEKSEFITKKRQAKPQRMTIIKMKFTELMNYEEYSRSWAELNIKRFGINQKIKCIINTGAKNIPKNNDE